MIFRALAVFSHQEDKYSTQPFRNASNTPIGSLTESAWHQDNPPSHHLSCHHGVSQQSADSCPYCSHSETRNDNSHVRRRKLRKVKPDYQQLRYEPPPVETIPSPRPESILSTHSRTLLLDPSRKASPNYAPHRTPNKLEKRHKMRRMASMAASSSFGFMALEINNSESSQSSPRVEERTAQPTRSSIVTEDLVPLAWTGEIQANMSAATSSHQNSGSPSFAPIKPRPKSDYSTRQWSSVVRKPKDVSAQTSSSSRPRSLAIVLSDDTISDDRLVDQLEDMRVKEPFPRRRRLSASDPTPTYQAVLNDSYGGYPPESDGFAVDDLSDSSWDTARQALLLCREMLRTECTYLASLKILAKGETSTFPPLIMFYHLPNLITASEEFLQIMTRNLSVRGVSEAFLAVQEKLNEAFINWCNVVATFSADDGRNATNDLEGGSLDEPVANVRRAASASVLDAQDSTAESVSTNEIRRNGKKQPSVRELAILPTQRIVHYVLLFKELLALTPPSYSYSFVVAQALHAAQTIASHSDESVHVAYKLPSN